MEFGDFVDRLDGVQLSRKGVMARCPNHDDRKPSLSVSQGEQGGVVVHCHAGCTTPDVVAALGLSMVDLMGAPYVSAVYDYTNAAGDVLYSVERWENPKDFRCRPGLAPVANARDSLPLPGDRVLFRRSAIDWAREHNQPIYVVEGEKDVMTLVNQAIPATCNVTGSGAWFPHYAEELRGLDVIVVADNDDAGCRHAWTVAKSLAGVAANVSVMHAPWGKDITDYLGAGYTIDTLAPLPEQPSLGIYLAATVKTTKVAWAWPGVIALKKLTIIEGDPGDGKSVLTIDLGARWSTGAPMPGQERAVLPAVPVILVSAEDDLDDTIVPRLRRAGANLNLVHCITHGATPEDPFGFGDLAEVRDRVKEVGAKIVVFDPLSAFLEERTDSHNDASVRRALYPLKALASTTGAAVLVVRHLTKGSGGKALYRGGGSIGFIGAARAAYLVAEHPEEPGTKLFACVKNNLAAKPPTMTYTVEVVDEEPYVKWGEPLDLGAQAILDGPERRKSAEAEDELASKRRAREMECEFLWDVVAEGPLTWQEIKDAGKVAGFSEISLRRARADVGLVQLGRGPAAKWTRPLDTERDQNAGHAHRAHPSAWQRATPRGEQDEQDPKIGDSLYPDGTTSEERDAQLDGLALVCSICTTEVDAMRYYKPHWVVRCPDHNPFTYGEQL